MTTLIGEEATLTFAAKIASDCQPPLIIYLQGDLGAGKTTFARGFVKELGYEGNVKSPTFTLVESYELDAMRLYHFDLYRLNDPLELEYIGVRELVGEQDVICLIEWPNKGGGELPPADLVIDLEYMEDSNGGSRNVCLHANSTKAQGIIDNL